MKFPSSVRFTILCTSVLAFAVSSSAQSHALRPITVDDHFQILSVHDPQVSPDGQWVAYCVDTLSLQTDKRETRIWLLRTGGGDPIPMTAEGVSSCHPRWSSNLPYPRLAFLSERDGMPSQVWVLRLGGGEAQRLTDTPQAVQDFSWSHDGNRLVLVLRDPSPEELESAKQRGAGPSSANAPEPDAPSKFKKPWVIDRLQFKADTIGYLDRRRTHLYTFDLASKSLTQVTSGDYDDSGPAWSPDSQLLAFTSNRSQPDPDATYNTDIWTVSAGNTDKGARPTQVTTNPGADDSPTWSPDGKTIAYVTMTDPKLFDYATRHLAVSPAAGGPARILTLSLDRMVSNPRFSPAGESIYFIVDDNGAQNLAQVHFGDGTLGARPISGSIMISSYSVGGGISGNVAGGTIGDLWTIAAEVATIDRPAEIYLRTPDGKVRQLTHTNDALFSQLRLSHGEYVHFQSKDGTPIAGYLYKPLDYTPGHKYPTLLIPHGGPVWAYYAEFSHLAQLYAANGYVVLFPNPRGSSGYGQDFCKAIYADWGNKDFQDDMAMVDYAIAQGFADPDKLGVGGWSYGGISTDFIITQTTRFKAAISGAGAAEFISLYGHDQYQRDYETELGLPWQSPDVWQHVSSYRNITKVTTPTLFLGGNIDWNVPILGGEQMYQSLKRLAVATELVVYPGEYHEFTLPSHIKDRLDRDLAWHGHYVKADGTPANPGVPVAAPKSSDYLKDQRLFSAACDRVARMKRLVLLLGILLFILGIAAMLHPSIGYHKHDEIAKIGPITATLEKEETTQIPVAVTVALLVSGLVLTALGARAK